MSTQPQFIVAEISKNWFASDYAANQAACDRGEGYGDTINKKLELVIEHNRRRGYRLHSFQLHRLFLDTSEPHVNETIIAVFERVAPPESAR